MSFLRRKSMAVCVLIALAAEIALLLLLLLLCAWLIQGELLPQSYLNVYIILCVFLSILPVCATTSWARGRGYLPLCLLCAAALCAVLLLTAASVKGLTPYGTWVLRVTGAALAAALSAAFLMIGRVGGRKRKRRR